MVRREDYAAKQESKREGLGTTAIGGGHLPSRGGTKEADLRVDVACSDQRHRRQPSGPEEPGVSTRTGARTGATIELNDVVMDYGKRERGGEHHRVIGPISLTIKRSEFVAILGPSGCGKTTLLRLVAGLELATSGQIVVNGEVVRGPSRRRPVVFQEPALYPWYNVRQNVAIGLLNLGIGRARRAEMVSEYLELVGMADFGWMRPRQLSGGMKQRVMIARTLAMQSPVVLMDEPFAALDEIMREALQEEILRVWAAIRPTIVFVTHSIPEATFLAERVVVLGPGQSGIIGEFPVEAEYPRCYAFRGSAAATRLRQELHDAMESLDVRVANGS